MDEQSDYEQYSTIVDMHKSPRFGYTSDIAQLASDDLNRRRDYIYGVVAFTAMLFSFFVIWSLVLLIFKWKGPEKCGCISGQMTEKADFESKTKALRKHRSIKFFFLLSCSGIIIGIILTLKEGMPRMKETIFDVRELNKDINSAVSEGLQIAETATLVQTNLKNSKIRDYLHADFCINYDDPQYTSNTYQEILRQIISSLESAEVYLEKHEIIELRSDIKEVAAASRKLEKSLQWHEENIWTPKMYVFLLGNLTLFLIGIVLFNCAERSSTPLRFMIKVLLVPLLSFLIVLGWIGVCAFAAGAIMNSDFCSGGGHPGSPEGTIQNALLENGVLEEDLMYQSFLYYKNSCTTKNPLDEYLSPYVIKIHSGIDSANEILLHAEETGLGNLNAFCGRDFSPVLIEIQKLQDDMIILVNTLEDTLELARCGRIMPLYRRQVTNQYTQTYVHEKYILNKLVLFPTFFPASARRVFYGVSCKDSVIGLTWLFIALLAISTNGMLIITLRSALYIREDSNCKDSIDEDEDIEWNNLNSQISNRPGTHSSGTLSDEAQNLSDSNENNERFDSPSSENYNERRILIGDEVSLNNQRYSSSLENEIIMNNRILPGTLPSPSAPRLSSHQLEYDDLDRTEDRIDHNTNFLHPSPSAPSTSDTKPVAACTDSIVYVETETGMDIVQNKTQSF